MDEPDLEFAVPPGSDEEEIRATLQEAMDKVNEQMAPLLEK